MQKLIKFTFLISISFICIYCNRNLESVNFDVIKYRKVDNNYYYSSHIKKYENSKYNPVITEKYKDGKLYEISLFKSEGIMDYSIAEIDSDKPLKRLLKLKDNKKIRIFMEKIIDAHKVYQISTIQNDSIFCSTKDSLIIFINK